MEQLYRYFPRFLLASKLTTSAWSLMAWGEGFEDVRWNLCLRKGCLRLDTLAEEGGEECSRQRGWQSTGWEAGLGGL